MTTQSMLDNRYGNTVRERRKTTLLLWIGGVTAAVILVLWVVWAGLNGDGDVIEQRDLGYTVSDETRVDVTFEVTTDRDTELVCTVKAMNGLFATVGWTTVELPASDERTRVFTEPVYTTERAVTGLLDTCWVA